VQSLTVAIAVLAGSVAAAQSDRGPAASLAPAVVSNLPGVAAAPAGGVALSTVQSFDGDATGLRVTVERAITSRLRLFAGGAPGAMLLESAATLGARYQLTTEAESGVATFVGTRYSGLGHEGRPELAVTVGAEKHLGATVVYTQVDVARELAEDQRDAELALAALRPVSARVQCGLAGHAVVDLDAGRNDGGEVRWEASAGPTASVRVGRAALLLEGGAVALATPATVRAGPFALASLAGWF
jgi:hypothetical protein